MKVLVFFSLIALVLAEGPNIQFRSSFGTAFVDPEELLEKSLYLELSSKGVVKVDVDSHRFNYNLYEVNLYTAEDPGDSLKLTLEKTLRSNLGFNDVVVKALPSKFYKIPLPFPYYKSSYEAHFSPDTMVAQMEALASKVYESTYFSLEDSRFD